MVAGHDARPETIGRKSSLRAYEISTEPCLDKTRMERSSAGYKILRMDHLCRTQAWIHISFIYFYFFYFILFFIFVGDEPRIRALHAYEPASLMPSSGLDVIFVMIPLFQPMVDQFCIVYYLLFIV